MFVAIYTTFSNLEIAKKYARILIDNRLSACVNLIPNILSIYRWDGKTEESQEYIVWIKTRESLIEKVYSKLKEIHSYDVPAFAVYRISSGSEEYLQWIKDETIP
jgi:periplasmic divalent cation tolerance protein